MRDRQQQTYQLHEIFIKIFSCYTYQSWALMLGLCRVALIIIEEDINHAVCSSLLLSLITNTFLHPKFVPSLSSRVVDYFFLDYLHVHFLKSVCHCHHFLLYPSYILYYLCYLLSLLIGILSIIITTVIPHRDGGVDPA